MHFLCFLRLNLLALNSLLKDFTQPVLAFTAATSGLGKIGDFFNRAQVRLAYGSNNFQVSDTEAFADYFVLILLMMHFPLPLILDTSLSSTKG